MTLNQLAQQHISLNNLKEVKDKYIQNGTPQVAIVMLSWRRLNRLIESLNNLLEVVKIPVALCLTVQEGNTTEIQDIVMGIANNFPYRVVNFTNENIGTGKPRHKLLHMALGVFNPKYIFFTDDDMIIPKFGIEALLTILENRPEFGAFNMHCKPKSNVWFFNDKGILYCRKPKKLFEAESVALGSATMMVRREVYDTCDLDPRYKIGCADIDFGMQMHKAGWKMGCLAIKDFYAYNKKGGDKVYNETRTNRAIVRKSVELFYSKWGQKL